MKLCLTVLIALMTASISAAGAASETLVAADGSGAFTTIQAAIAAAPANATSPYVIHIAPGVYQGQIIIPKDKPFLCFVGKDASRTVVTWSRQLSDDEARGYTVADILGGADHWRPDGAMRTDNK
ncbi:MAG TPA: pectinesterase family protein [Opitutaceae bacterium]|nr:pectinesterase family protein [Opitutaceae bacterium]